MSRALIVFALALAVGFLCLSTGRVSAQDCERAIPGNSESPCKRLDYLDGIQAPAFLVEQLTDQQGRYTCQGYLEFKSSTPLQDHSEITTAGSSSDLLSTVCTDCWSWGGDQNIYARGDYAGYYLIKVASFVADGESVRTEVGPEVHLTSSVSQSFDVYPYLVIAARFLNREGAANYNYTIVSDTFFDRPKEVADYQLLMNQCLAGITRQLEHDAAVEAARKQAEEDRIRAETAAEEVKNKAELAAIELKSAQDALKAQEELNTSLLQETILSVKREDAIRAAWQQVILVRMAGLEERTAIWNEAVNRWAEEDLQFSTAMEARIQEVSRLQALNAALERSMTEQRRLLIAQLEDLEEAEREALEKRDTNN